LEDGNRAQKLDAYRALREDLNNRINTELQSLVTSGSQTS
jgi:hypothetical protein